MTRIQAHGIDRFLRKGARTLLVALDEFNPAHDGSLDQLADEIVSGGAEGLIVTLAQADELSEHLAHVAILVRANSAEEIDQAYRVGFDAAVVTRAALIPAEHEAHFGIVFAGTAEAKNADARLLTARVSMRTNKRGAPTFVLLESARSERELLKRASELIRAGARGLVIGRIAWEHHSPRALVKALNVIVEGKTVEQAEKILAKEMDKDKSPTTLKAEM